MTEDDTTQNGATEAEKVEKAPEMEGNQAEDAPLKAKRKRGRPAGASPPSGGGGSKKGKKGKKGKKTKSAEGAEGAEAAEGAEGENGEAANAKPSKPKKKVMPYWATVSDAEKQKMAQKMGPIGVTGVSVIVDAIQEVADKKGMASYILIKKHVTQNNPSWPKMVFKVSDQFNLLLLICGTSVLNLFRPHCVGPWPKAKSSR